jgi:glycosyltransferase involved in cell wall biosynthesis
MDQNMTPKISVIMPVFNGAKYIKESIKSILNQSFRDFELLIINDGSTDNSSEIVTNLKDERIKLIKNSSNSGLVKVRNQGMNLATGKYIAWLDSDDLSLPNRLKIQNDYLDRNQNVIAVGSWVRLIKSSGEKAGVEWKNNFSGEEIPAALFFGNQFAQSSIMARKEFLLKTPYREGYAPAEDYDVWIRLAKIGKIETIKKILIYYREHGFQTSKLSDNKIRARNKIIADQLVSFGIETDDNNLDIHGRNYPHPEENLSDFLKKKENWLKLLISKNENLEIFDRKIFNKVAAHYWLLCCRLNTEKGSRTLSHFFDSKIAKNLDYRKDGKSLIKMFLKSFF